MTGIISARIDRYTESSTSPMTSNGRLRSELIAADELLSDRVALFEEAPCERPIHDGDLRPVALSAWLTSRPATRSACRRSRTSPATRR